MNRIVLAVGLVITFGLLGLLFMSLGNDPHTVRSPLVGQIAPQFALRTVGANDTLSLDGFRGRPVIVNFWATWCVPCHQEHPILVAAAQRYGAQITFVGVVFEDEEATILEFLRRQGSAYPTLIDPGGKTSIAYGIGGVPETFFIDATGKIIAKYEGPLTPDLMNGYIGRLLGTS